MMREGIAIATITLARDRAEEMLIQGSLEALSAMGLPVMVADGGSSPAFTRAIGVLPHVTLVESRPGGLVGQIQASLAAAHDSGAPSILYGESDKQTFFEERLARFIDAAPLSDDVGIAIAARSEASFETFPAFQKLAERATNALCADLIGVDGDYSYGPFLLHRDLVAHVMSLPSDIGWGWRPFLFALAQRLGHHVVHVVDDHACPEAQRGEHAADRVHRLRQLAQNANGLALAMNRASAHGQ